MVHTDEGQVDDLKQPGWNFGAKDEPAVVLIVTRNETILNKMEKGC